MVTSSPGPDQRFRDSMPPMHYDAIVIGIGAMGSAACHHLARRGARVLGLEQFDIPNELGSSSGVTRMIRLAYYEHPDYVPLLRRAYERWEELEAEAGEKLLYLTGGLYLGPRDGELVTGSLESARLHKLEHELLERDELRRRFPQFRTPDDWLGLFENRAGFLMPQRAIAAHARVALRHGAELRAREPVVGWERDGAGVHVTTAKGEYSAEKLIVCGGAWSGTLLRSLGIPLCVTRQTMGWFWPKTPEAFALGRLPVWAIENPDRSLYYGFPMIADVPGFKIARHGPGAETDPDRVIREPVAGDEEDLHAGLRRFVPDGDGPLLALRTCLYTNSPDGHFIIDRHPENENVILACGFSGHGFKFASVIGEVLADLAMKGRTEHSVGFLRVGRARESKK